MKYIVLWVNFNEEFVKGSRAETDLILFCYPHNTRINFVVLHAVDKRRCY